MPASHWTGSQEHITGSKVFQQGHHAYCQAHNQLFMKTLKPSGSDAARARQMYTL